MPQEFDINDTIVRRLPVQASMSNGALLRCYRYQSNTIPNKRRKNAEQVTTPLLCLGTELGSGREHHRFALALASQYGAAQRIYTLDLRGRGRSDDLGVAESDISNDADDLISFCDAHNLHLIDMVVSGFSVIVLFRAITKRPGLVRKLILNDATPEFDAVGIARRAALAHRADTPASWEAAAEMLQSMKGEEFPYFEHQDWLDMARHRWRDVDGKPSIDTAKGLVRWSNMADYDNRQPNLWPEFAVFNNRPVLLIKGEYSGLVTPEIVEKTAAHHADLKVITAKGQGHVPQLERGHLTDNVLDFLLDG